jgi:hypothetical protein
MLLSACIVVLLGLMLFNSGIITSEKMQLQNAADAAAYSVSTIEARDLNFTAYINRAMIANEVAVGQMVGLMSWAVHFASVGSFMNLYFNPILSALEAGTLGIAAFFTIPMRILIAALTIVGNTLRTVTRVFTSSLAPLMSGINKVYSIAQKGFHMVSFLFSVFALDEMLKQNADDAELSGFGMVALFAHFASLYGITPFSDGFVTSYSQDSTEPEQQEGMQRLASIINAGRDPFSLDRDGGWSFPLVPTIGFDYTLEIDFGLFEIEFFSVAFSFGVTMDRNGGTDLRFIENNERQLYNWSAADTTAVNLQIRFYLRVLYTELFDLNIRGGPPFGIGGAQAGLRTGPRRAVVGSPSPTPVPNMLPETGVGGVPLGGEVSLDMYGGSPGISPVAWVWPGPVPPGGFNPSQAAFTNNIAPRYPGLPRYNDTKPGADPIDVTKPTLGMEAPYLLIGLIKENDNIRSSKAAGRFALTEEYAADQLGVISKSEVYFSRPDDLGYFRRADGKVEYGSGFNPYWQARLVDTTYIDRLSALAIQQRQLYLPSLPLGPVIDDIEDLLSLLP